MDIFDALFISLVLALALAGVLWGLRIFKIFLIVLGVWAGFAMGMLVGDFFAADSGSLLIWGLSGAVIGGLLAWPLQKIFVFTGVGLLIGFLVFAMVMSRGGEPQTGLIAGATTLVIAGFIAVMIYDYFIIVLMTMVSAYLIINVCYLPFEFRHMFEVFLSGKEGIVETLGTFGGLYSQLIWPSLVVLCMFLLYAIFMQKILRRDRGDKEDSMKLGTSPAWKTAFMLASILVVYAFIDSLFGFGKALFSGAQWISLGHGFNAISPGQEISVFCHNPILNFSPISFPAAAIAAFIFIKWHKSNFPAGALGGNRWINGWLAGIILGIVVLPLIDMIILSAILKFDNLSLALGNWLGFYRAFVAAPLAVVLIKWSYVLAIFPFLLTLIIPAPTPQSDSQPKEPQVNYCI
jgi:hypothetical protein